MPRMVMRGKKLWSQLLLVVAMALALPAMGCEDEPAPVGSQVPLHIWVSNQSLGTGIAEVRMTVSLNGRRLFNELMAVGTQHNVAMVDAKVSRGSHKITTVVGDPYRLTTDELVEVAGERWVLVRFWYDPISVHENQRTPTITVDSFDADPGIK